MAAKSLPEIRREITDVLRELEEVRSSLLENLLKKIRSYYRDPEEIESLENTKFKELCAHCTKAASLISELLALGEGFKDLGGGGISEILEVLSRVTRRAVKGDPLVNLLHDEEVIRRLAPLASGDLDEEDIITPLSSTTMFEALIGLKEMVHHPPDVVGEALRSLLGFLTDPRITSEDLGFYDIIYFNINGIRPVLHDLTVTSRVLLTFCLCYGRILSNRDIFGEELVERTRKCIARTTSGVIRLVDHCIRGPLTSEWMTYLITKKEADKGNVEEVIPRFDEVRRQLEEQTRWIIDPRTRRGLHNLLNVMYMLLIVKELLLLLEKEEAEKLEDEMRKARGSERSVHDELNALLAFLYGRFKKKMCKLLEEVREGKKRDMEACRLIEEILEEENLIPGYEDQRIVVRRRPRSIVPYLARFLIKIYTILDRVLESGDRNYRSLLKEEDIQTLYALLGWTARLLAEIYRCRRKMGRELFGVYLRGGTEYDLSELNYYILRNYIKNFDSIERVFLGDPEGYLLNRIAGERREERQPLEVTIRPLGVREEGKRMGKMEVVVADREDPSYYKKFNIVVELDEYLNNLEGPARGVSELCSRLRSGEIDITADEVGNFREHLENFRRCLENFHIRRGREAFVKGQVDELEGVLSSLERGKPIVIKLPSEDRDQLWELSHRFLWELIKVGDKPIGLSFPVGRVILSKKRREQRAEAEGDVIRVLLVRGCGSEEDEEIFGKEIEDLKRLFEGIRSEGYYIIVEVAETWKELERFLLEEGRRWDILHYAGHTAYERDVGWIWMLEGGTLRVAPLRDEMQAPSLVFSNSCESARSGSYYGGHVQFPAKGFLERGTRAYIGTLFPLETGLALKFSKKFYEEILQEKRSVGESLLFARQEVVSSDSVDKLVDKLGRGGECDTGSIKEVLATVYACYVLYGDPLYRLVG